MKNRTKLLTTQVSVFFICLLCAVFSCNPPEYKEIEVCHKIVSKYHTTVATNGMGEFENRYYILYDNDEVRAESLQTFMKYEVGTTLCWYEEYRTK